MNPFHLIRKWTWSWHLLASSCVEPWGNGTDLDNNWRVFDILGSIEALLLLDNHLTNEIESVSDDCTRSFTSTLKSKDHVFSPRMCWNDSVYKWNKANTIKKRHQFFPKMLKIMKREPSFLPMKIGKNCFLSYQRPISDGPK